ncbi:MAG: hypothetical protein FWD52_09445 [Candidatus Bathyarchaeota archaeon]|nr:hypothetical protein [Candidatus Termiticorpusculum sp.]
MVETEAELVNAIDAAPDEGYIIVISKNITLEKSLEIPAGKRIMLIGNVFDICLIGANTMDTIIVRDGGWLRIIGTMGITHAKGDTGRGIYVERGGTCIIQSAIISGNTADLGGGVYNEGTFDLSAAEDPHGLIVNNTATLGGGVYNTGTFTMLFGDVRDNNAADSGGGVYNVGTFDLRDGEICGNNAAGLGGGVYNEGTFNMKKNRYGSDGELTIKYGSICGNVAAKGGGMYNVGTFEMPHDTQISENTALSSEGENVFNEESAGVLPYLLVIVVAVTVVVSLIFIAQKNKNYHQR